MKKQAIGACRKFLKFLPIPFLRKYREWVRRVAVLFLCTALILNFCACWNRRELNTLAIVLGTGLDVGNQPDTLELTAQVVRAGEMKSGGSSPDGSASAEKAFVNMQGTDKSVLAAVRGISHMANRRLYFPHNQVLIFSSELAKQDIAEGLDAFLRDYEARMNVHILVSKGKASEVLEEECELEKIPSVHISGMIENQEPNSETVIVTRRDFALAMLSGSTAPVAPMIEVHESGGKKRGKLEGTAVFKDGKMVGELDGMQTRGLMFATGKAKSSVITVDTKWGQVVLEMVHSRTSLEPVKAEDGSIRIELKINENGAIESNETTEDMSRLENLELLKKLGQEAIRSDVESALSQARSLSADVFGFGEAIRREYPEEWEKMKENWDEVFREIGLDVQVEVELRSTGGLTRPVTPGGAE